MRRAIRALLPLFAAVLIAVPVVPLGAAEKATAWESVDVVVHDEQGSTLLIVSGTLSDDVKLPARVELAVPTGSEFQWVGEILGGDVADDPAVEPEQTTQDGSDVYSFVLSQSRTGQIEVVAPAGTMASNGSTTSGTLSWTTTTPIGQLRMKFRVPETAQVQPYEGANLTQGPPGFSYLERIVEDVQPGQTETLELVAVGGSAAAPTGAPQSAAAGGTSPALWIALALVALGVVFIGRGVLAKMRAKSETPEDESASATARPARTISANIADKKLGTPTPTVDQDAAIDEADPTTPTPRRSARPLIIGLIVVAFVAGALIAVNSGRSAIATGDTIEMTYAQVDTCTTSNLGLTPPAGTDLAKDGQKVLEALRSVVGLGNATVYVKESRVEARYCDSQVAEQQILDALAAAGWTATPIAPATEQVVPAETE